MNKGSLPVSIFCRPAFRSIAGRDSIESADEVPVMIKTSEARYPALQAALREQHPYELPEIVAVPVTHGCRITWPGCLPRPNSITGFPHDAFPRFVLLWMAASLAGAADLLHPAQAFKPTARALDGRTVEVRFAIADGYYLYRDKFRFAVETEGVKLGMPSLPRGKEKIDETFGNVEVFYREVLIRLPVGGTARECCR